MKVFKEKQSGTKEMYFQLSSAEHQVSDMNFFICDIYGGGRVLYAWIDGNTGKMNFMNGVKNELLDLGYNIANLQFDDSGKLMVES